MTPKEYKERLDALKEQETQLAQEFINNNPFKELEGKFVNLKIGCSKNKVLFVGAKITSELGLFYHNLKKDGTPQKRTDYIPARIYDGKFYKFEKL